MGTLKKFLPDMLAVMAFVIIAFAYFWTPASKGLVLTGHDHSGAVGSGVEMQHYRDTHDGDRTRWTNSLFSGMPTYQMAPSYDSSDMLGKAQNVYQLWLPSVVAYVFMMLLGFYIMLRAFNFKTWMAALGAILWAFSSYYFIIIAAGHIWKVLALCYIPPTIGGIVLCYRKKYIAGVAVTGIFTAMQIFSNHIQMTYYFGFVIAFLMLAYLINSLIKGKACAEEVEEEEMNAENNAEKATCSLKQNWKPGLKAWGKATACVFIGIVLGVLVNLSNLYHTWEYSKESMRSKSELTEKTKDAKNQTNDGLERSYITEYSYDVNEIFTLLVPNAKGGASMALAENESALKKASKKLSEVEGYVNAINSQYGQQVLPMPQDMFAQYFGDPHGTTGTSGPVYVGAFVCFLFVLGLLIVKGPMKWCLLAVTIMSVFLSFGKNMMWFTDLFLDFVPMYDKFRTVESILVIAEFTMPLLGLMALKKIIDHPTLLHEKQTMIKVYASLAITAGACLLLWISPSIMGPYVRDYEMAQLQSLGDPALITAFTDSITAMRQALVASDAMRSFLIIIVGFAALMVYRSAKAKGIYVVGFITALCLFDMWQVNKRYLNDNMFVTPTDTEELLAETSADKAIKQEAMKLDALSEGASLDYRVLDMTQSTFNSNAASAHHKSIGGYHAAKLRRYQELCDEYISKEMQALPIYQTTAFDSEDDSIGHPIVFMEQDEQHKLPVLNMLNMRYVIVNPNGAPVENTDANGCAWFVDEVKYVDNADDEMAMLGKIDNKVCAVANKQYKDVLGEGKTNTKKTVHMTRYEANELQYEVESTNGGVLVFSEIFYPGWTATVDGQDVEIGRVNYVLRAIRIDGGKHNVVLKFDPQSVHTTDTIAYIALITLVVMLIGALVLPQIKKRKAQKKLEQK